MCWDALLPPIDVVTTTNGSLMMALFVITELLVHTYTHTHTRVGELMHGAPRWSTIVVVRPVFLAHLGLYSVLTQRCVTLEEGG